LPAPPIRPNPAFRNSSTTSIVNAYVDEHIRTPLLGKKNEVSLFTAIMNKAN
jgi:hypothetical protein